MTLEKLAKLANVSVSTASKAFSGSPEISQKTRDKIFQTARKEGCFEKYYKAGYSRKVIAVICPEIRSEYYAGIVTLLGKKLEEKGADMVISLSNFQPERERTLFGYHSFFQKADGVILLSMTGLFSNQDHIPCVAFTSELSLSGHVDLVNISLQKAITAAVLHLKELGHRDICFLGEELTVEKAAAFLRAMEKAGLDASPDRLLISDKRFGSAGFELMESLFQREKLPTAVVAAYDYMAFGAISCIRSHGLTVPGDISVMGMDDISAASFLDVGLTSVQTHVEEICDIALDVLWKKISNPYFTVRQTVTVEGDLIVRGSTGPAPLR